MKTAILISGQARTFSRCLPSIHWHVFRKLEKPAFFVSVADDADAPSVELLRQQYPEAEIHLERVVQPQLPEPPPELASHAPYYISSPVQGVLRQLWHLSRVWKFFEANKGDVEYTTIIRCRPDLHFHSCEWLGFRMNESTAMIPFWGNYGGVNDRFAVLGIDAARAYCEAYDKLPALLADGCPLHPESLVCAALEKAGMRISRTLDAQFAARRKNNELIHMQVLPQELAAWTAHLSCK